MSDIFCGMCGSKLIAEERGDFDTETGNPEMIYYCQENPCGHTGCIRDFSKEEEYSFLDVFLGMDFKCKRCGKKNYCTD